MKTKILLITIIISLYYVGSLATVVDNATIPKVPSSDSKGKSHLTLVKHPEYKKLVDDLRELQEKLKTADDKSVAIGRQRVDAAFNRLREYIDAGKPTFLTINQSNITSTSNLTQEDAYQKYIAAYNKLTQLNVENKGDTPEAQRAYEKYKDAKEKYEKILKANQQTGNTQREDNLDNDSGGSTSTVQKDRITLLDTNDEVTGESPIFLSDDMYQFYKTPAQITYYVVIDYLFKEGDVSNVGSPEIKTKQVNIDVVLHGKKQKIRFLESSRMDDVSEVLVEQVGKNEVMLIQLQKIKDKWAIIPDALDGAMLREKKEPGKDTKSTKTIDNISTEELYKKYIAAYKKLTQMVIKTPISEPVELKNISDKYREKLARYNRKSNDRRVYQEYISTYNHLVSMILKVKITAPLSLKQAQDNYFMLKKEYEKKIK